MSAQTATITITNLRLRTFIGFNKDERRKKQDVVLNIVIRHRLNNGVFDDQVEDALNYKYITKQIINYVEQGRFLLLEKMVSDVVGICSDNDAVLFAQVTADKPHALRFADSVSVSMEYDSRIAVQQAYLEKVS